MAEMNISYKKIVWKLNKTKEELEAFQLGDEIESPQTEIMLGGNLTKWCLSFYPRGHDEEDKDCAGIFLCLEEADSKEFKAKFTLGVIGKIGNEEHNFEYSGKSFDAGTPNLLRQDELYDLDRGFFVDGSLTFYCQLTLSDDVTERDGQALSKQNALSDKRMLADELFTDFKVQTFDKKVLKVHKNILAVRSPHFYEKLMKETYRNVAKVPEDASIMKAVLSFIYTGEVENLDAIVFELLFVAKKYQLKELKKLCIESIIKKVSWENAVKTLLVAEGLTDSEKLKEKCIDVITSNFAFLRTTAEWEAIPPSLFTEIILHVASEINHTINI